MKQYYSDPRRFEDAEMINREYNNVMEDSTYCTSTSTYLLICEWLMTEGIISSPYRSNVWFRYLDHNYNQECAHKSQPLFHQSTFILHK